MSDETYKLPKVTESVRFAVQNEFPSGYDPNYMRNLIRKYEQSNPQVIDWLGSYVNSQPESLQFAATLSCIMTLRLLESQGEAGAMNRVYGNENKDASEK